MTHWKFPGYDPKASIDWDGLEERYDWFRKMKGVPQDPIWHAEGDVFIHTKMVVEALVSQSAFAELPEQDKHTLFAAAMLHDVEKPSTTRSELIDDVERIVSPRHAKKGEFAARSILYRELNCPLEVREQIAKLVRWHGLPLWAISKEDPEKTVVEASLAVNTVHLSMLARADVNGRICEDHEDFLLKIDLFDEQCREANCFGKAHEFASPYARYWYLNKRGSAIGYEPYDDREFDVYMMCGMPGSGKDTYIQKNLTLPMLSLDDIRREHKIDPDDRKGNGKVIQMAKDRAREMLRAKTAFVFNATNISRDIRDRWTSLFHDYHARIHIVYIEVPYKTVLQQNQNRQHVVPESVIERLLGKLEMPSYAEADHLHYNVKD